MQYSAILLVMVTHSLPEDHPNSASSSSWHLELLWQHKAQSQLGSACRSRNCSCSPGRGRCSCTCTFRLGSAAASAPTGPSAATARNVSLGEEALSTHWNIYLAYGSPGSTDSLQDPSRCSLREKCISQGILLQKYLNICSLLCCCVKRHQKGNKRAWVLHKPLTPPHYKWSRSSLMN